MNTFGNDFHDGPQLEKVGKERRQNVTTNGRGEDRKTNQTLEFLYQWQGWGTKTSYVRSCERHVSVIKQAPPPPH